MEKDENIEEQEVKSKRDLLYDRMKGKYPDREFEDDEGLYGATLEDMDGYDEQLARQQEVDQQLTDKFENDPQFASYFMGALSGENPITNLIAHYGDQFKDALEDPEIADELAQAHEEHLSKLGKEKELNEQFESNMEATLALVDEIQSEGEFTDDQMNEAFNSIFENANKIIMGELTRDMLETYLKGLKYDDDVAGAAETARVGERNKKIEAKKKDLKSEIPMLDGAQQQAAPTRPKNQTLDSLDAMTNSRDIWEGAKKRTI